MYDHLGAAALIEAARARDGLFGSDACFAVWSGHGTVCWRDDDRQWDSGGPARQGRALDGTQPRNRTTS